MKYSAENPPAPWDVPYETNKAFIEERWDDYPKGGFLEDVVLYQKGYETTNFLSFWTGVHYVSSMIMRDSHLRWAHGGMFPNFYFIMVAPPSLVKKSTTIHGPEKAEMLAHSLFANPIRKFKKSAVTIRGKATPEAIFASMANERLPVKLGEDENGDDITETVEKNANLVIRVSELSTFLSQSKYNVTLIDKLTDFYDCKDADSDTTIQRGNIELKNIFCTLMGATTPDTLASTIPKEAFGGGFVSRSIILREDYTERIFPEPVAYPDLPGPEELGERLAWIGEHKRGEFVLTEDAYDFYAKWYTKNKMDLRKRVLSGNTDHEHNRQDIHVLKLAHIFALQRYTLASYVTLSDIKTAIKIVKYTLGLASEILKETSASESTNNLRYIEKTLQRLGEVRRKNLISRVYHRGINAELLTSILDELVQADKITIKRGNVKKTQPSRDKEEVYTWKKSKKVDMQSLDL